MRLIREPDCEKSLNGILKSWVYGKSICNVPKGKSYKAFDSSGDMTLVII